MFVFVFVWGRCLTPSVAQMVERLTVVVDTVRGILRNQLVTSSILVVRTSFAAHAHQSAIYSSLFLTSLARRIAPFVPLPHSQHHSPTSSPTTSHLSHAQPSLSPLRSIFAASPPSLDRTNKLDGAHHRHRPCADDADDDDGDDKDGRDHERRRLCWPSVQVSVLRGQRLTWLSL